MYLYPTKETLGLKNVLCDDKNHYFLGEKNDSLVFMTVAKNTLFSIKLTDSSTANEVVRTTVEKLIVKGGLSLAKQIPSSDRPIDMNYKATQKLVELFDAHCGSQELLLFKFLEKSKPLRKLVDKLGLTLVRN